MSSRLLLTAKEHAYRDDFRFMAGEMARVLRAREPSVSADSTLVTWLPRRPRAVREKGHDQAKLLAFFVARELRLPIAITLQNHGEMKQQLLNREERMANARVSYSLARKRWDVTGKTVIVIDDLITTGSGMLAAIRLLREEGVARVIPLSFARTANPPRRMRGVSSV